MTARQAPRDVSRQTERDHHYLHSPTLETVVMVERTIKDSDLPQSRTELWKSLRKGVMYQTYKEILEYLEASGKIIFDKNGKVIWVAADNPKLREFFDRAENLK